MSNITCPSCGGQKATQINDREYRCEYCGHVFSLSSGNATPMGIAGFGGANAVNIHGYTQWFAVNPKVDVYCNGQQIAAVGKGETVTIDISSCSNLTFNCMGRKTSIMVTPGADTDLYISFDRVSGALLVTNSLEQKASNDKNRTTAALMAFFLGGFGGHQFYLGNTGKGILYLVFCWTYIPCIIALIEGIMLITQSDEDFNVKPKLLL